MDDRDALTDRVRQAMYQAALRLLRRVVDDVPPEQFERLLERLGDWVDNRYAPLYSYAMTTNPPPPWKALREASGLSQREIERRVGMKPGRLSVIERGLIPTDAEAAKLRAVLVAAMDIPEATA